MSTPNTAIRDVPTLDWVDPQELRRDPYPIYERLRAEAPVAWVPAVGKVLVTGFAGCVFAEQHPEIFSSHIENAHMVRAVNGRPMIRKDDPDHAAERSTVNPTLRPKRIMEVWAAKFAANAERGLDELEARGPAAADLNRDFAGPFAARNLMDILGFRDVDVTSFIRWSNDYIAGAGNVLEDPAIWERCDRSRAETNAVLDELLPHLERHPDDSMTSLLLHSGMPESSVRANVMLTISGGVNEPQHMVTNIAHLLDEHPQDRPADDAPASEWGAVFHEAVRLCTPIGMITRETTADVALDDVMVPAASQVGLVLASANRDASAFSNPDAFVVNRPEQRNLGFGSGTHMCAGKWVAESSVGHVAMPALYRRFPGLRVDESRETTWDGWVFRGLTALPMTWG